MWVAAAFMGVVFIWSTTPLAIQASQDSVNFLMALALRVVISAVLAVPVLRIMGLGLPLHRAALTSYLAGAVGVYGAMLCVYWGAAYLPSGLISVLYGLSPMLSGAMAYWWLGERELTPARILALVIAVTGLGFVVAGRLMLDEMAWRGIVGTLVSVFLFAVSAVWTKECTKNNERNQQVPLHPLQQTAGTLWMSSIFFALTLALTGTGLPQYWSQTSLIAIGYLAVAGSLLGFVLYFYVLNHLSAARVTMITLIAPVLAVFWGYWFMEEVLLETTLQGVILLLGGLAMYLWPGYLDRVFSRVSGYKAVQNQE